MVILMHRNKNAVYSPFSLKKLSLLMGEQLVIDRRYYEMRV